jgi:hypothetical protein
MTEFLRTLTLGLAGALLASVSVAAEFANPELVRISGYSGPAQDPFPAVSDTVLLFNSHTDDRTIPAIQRWAQRKSYNQWSYKGEVAGANNQNAIQGSGNADAQGNFYFFTNQYYPQSLNSAYRGRFDPTTGALTNIQPVLGVSRRQLGWVTMEPVPTADGRLYYGDFQLPNPGQAPNNSKLAVAAKNPDGSFTKLANSDMLLANVNAVNNVVYNGVESPDGLELVFTALVSMPPGPVAQIYIATRGTPSAPFGVPHKIAAIDALGAVENGGFSADGKRLYFHRVMSAGDARIYVATR